MAVETPSARAIFERALELASDADRQAYLDECCASDPELRDKVEALLRAHAEAGSFLGQPAMQSPETHDYEPIAERSGTVVGPYKLLEQIGEGGFGVVFMAEQERPVSRRVALKVIKPGMDTRACVARFEAERQALALMDHPNIAKVFDAGATETGRPYFVMELVRGIPITEFCDQNSLSVSERLELFMTVCHAVQHAHQKGVIHRDIKPTNVLVTLHDGRPVAKVIDFGVAKATGQRLTDKTFFTAFAQMLGTPLYMSPEQAEMSGLDVDTRSDIYSLGVLLYELLTGTTPFDRARMREAAYDEIRRIIRDEEPPKPSTRISTLGQAATTISTQRKSEPDKLRRLFRGDLDWIVMKCLEKDRNRRYDTANSLAADLRRHLDNEPVTARPPSTAYRLRKAWLRNRIVYTAGLAVAAALLVGLLVSLWQTAVARSAQRDAETARLDESKQRQAAQAATRRAEQHEEEMRRRAYAADVNLAHQAAREHNLGRARELLDRNRPEAGQEDLRGWEWRYTWGLCQSDAEFKLCRLPKSDAVLSTAVRPGGNWVALGGYMRNGVEVWDLSARRRVEQLAAGEGFARVAFSPDGSRLAFSTNQRLRVWDCGTRSIIADVPVDRWTVSVSFSADSQTIITCERDSAIRLWRASDLEMIRSTPIPEGLAWFGSPFAVSTDLKTAVHVEGFNGIVVVDLESGQERWRYKSPLGNPYAMAISPDGERLATSFGTADGTIQIWDLTSGDSVTELVGHRAWVSTLKFSADGKTLVSASADQTLRIWDVEHFKPIRTLQGHTLEVWSLDISSDGSTLVSGSKNGEVLVWDAQQDPHRIAAWTVPGHHANWEFSSNGEAIYALERDSNRLLRYAGPTFARGKALQKIQFDGTGLFSPSGRFFAATTTSRSLRVWNLDERKLVHEIPIGSPGYDQIQPLAFSADDTRVWLQHNAGEDPEESILNEWELKEGTCLRSIDCSVHRRRWYPRGQRFLLHPDDWAFWVEPNYSAVFHDLRTGQISRPALATDRLSVLMFASPSPDGKLLVLGHELGVVTIWETASLIQGATPRRVATLGGILMSFHDAAFFAEGTRLLAGSSGSEAIKVWETQGYNELLNLTGDGSIFYRIQFSEEGGILGALNEQGTLHLWRAPTWDEIEASEKAARMTTSIGD
jgi:serine/threonine protein kinase/WD40 repeat protein